MSNAVNINERLYIATHLMAKLPAMDFDVEADQRLFLKKAATCLAAADALISLEQRTRD